MPRHVAVVMDGHARWARARGLPMADGHHAGLRTLHRIVRLSRAWGAEVDFLMRNLEAYIRDSADEFSRDGVRLHVIGDSPSRPASLLAAAREAYEATSHNSDLVFMLIAGRLATGVAAGDEELSYPDLVIRTSGEQRLSNFLLWQSAYSELYFADTMWPDFDEDAYLKALASYTRAGIGGLVKENHRTEIHWLVFSISTGFQIYSDASCTKLEEIWFHKSTL
ncbi:hypothetical protein EJB05_12798, partial [Eragrostis curvula]